MPSFNQFSTAKKKALLSYLYDENIMRNEADGKNNDWVDALNEELQEFEVPYSHTGYNRFLDQEGY